MFSENPKMFDLSGNLIPLLIGVGLYYSGRFMEKKAREFLKENELDRLKRSKGKIDVFFFIQIMIIVVFLIVFYYTELNKIYFVLIPSLLTYLLIQGAQHFFNTKLLYKLELPKKYNNYIHVSFMMRITGIASIIFYLIYTKLHLPS